MKQTAVEWFIKKIAEDYPEIPKAYREECNKAKEMEKEQMKEFYQDGCFLPFPSDATFEKNYIEKYENES
jgi:hypothetical protein